MDARTTTALLLVALMSLAGCLGATEPAQEGTEVEEEAYSLNTTWIVAPEELPLGEEAVFVLGVQQEGSGSFIVEYAVLQSDFSPLEDLEWIETDVGYRLRFTPKNTGEHIVSISFTNTGSTSLEPAAPPPPPPPPLPPLPAWMWMIFAQSSNSSAQTREMSPLSVAVESASHAPL